MLQGRRGRLLLSLVLLVAGFLVSLAEHSLTYTVKTDGLAVVVETTSHRFRGELGNATSLEIRYYPQDRHSTAQILVPDRGPLLNGLAILARLGRRLAPEPPVYRQEPDTVRRYVHFNPFRGGFTVHRGQPELRLEVNVPDDSMESWQEGRKTQAVKLAPPWLRLALAPVAASACLAGILAVLALLFAGEPQKAGPASPEEAARASNRRIPAAVFIAGTLLGAAVFHGVFHAMPGFGDEMNYLWQGRIFASGHLSVPEPPDPDFFLVGWMDMFGGDHRIWGFHPPGNAALLAIGWLVHVPWLTVPLVFGGILAAAYMLALEILGSVRWALVNVVVVATSHYVLSLSSSFMAHAPSDLVLTLFFLCLVRFVRTGRARLLLLAALWAGLAFCIRPMSALLAALVPLPVVFFAARRKVSARTWAAAAAIGLGVSALVFLYTWGITGRFTLPYAIKGPEVGQTVWVRLTRGWYVHATNFFRNANEFQHRAHSFGILGNTVFFVLPLVLAAARLVPLGGPLALAYTTFGGFVVGHSVLHWYGWKWEPRMLFDISFLFFLGTAAGLQRLSALLPDRRAVRRAGWAAAAAGLLFLVAHDLPWRVKDEYHDYNAAPRGVREAIARNGIRNAVIFFGAEKAFACYTPENAVTFDGDLVYAREQGDLLDYRLLARFPGKRAFFTPDGNSLVPKPNFYRQDAATAPRRPPEARPRQRGGRDAVALRRADAAQRRSPGPAGGSGLASSPGSWPRRPGRRPCSACFSRARRSSPGSRTCRTRARPFPEPRCTRGRSRSGGSGQGGPGSRTASPASG